MTQNYPINPSLDQKLEAIAAAEPTVKPVVDRDLGVEIVENHYLAYFCDAFQQPVPYVEGLSFELCEQDEGSMLEITKFDLGDQALQGHGIGTRLLRKAVEYGIENSENLTTLTMSPANRGVIHAVRKVVGEEYVAFRHDLRWYGEGEDVPRVEGDRYRVQEVRAFINPDHIQRLGGTAVQKQAA